MKSTVWKWIHIDFKQWKIFHNTAYFISQWIVDIENRVLFLGNYVYIPSSLFNMCGSGLIFATHHVRIHGDGQGSTFKSIAISKWIYKQKQRHSFVSKCLNLTKWRLSRRKYFFIEDFFSSLMPMYGTLRKFSVIVQLFFQISQKRWMQLYVEIVLCSTQS